MCFPGLSSSPSTIRSEFDHPSTNANWKPGLDYADYAVYQQGLLLGSGVKLSPAAPEEGLGAALIILEL